MNQGARPGRREAPAIISRESLIPIGVALAVALSFCGFTWAAAVGFSELRHEVSLNRRAIEQLDRTVLKTAQDSFTLRDMVAWCAEMRAANPTLKIPPPTK